MSTRVASRTDHNVDIGLLAGSWMQVGCLFTVCASSPFVGQLDMMIRMSKHLDVASLRFLGVMFLLDILPVAIRTDDPTILPAV